MNDFDYKVLVVRGTEVFARWLQCGWLWMLLLAHPPATGQTCPETLACTCKDSICSQQNQYSCQVVPASPCDGLFYQRLPDSYSSNLLNVTSTGHSFSDYNRTVNFSIAIIQSAGTLVKQYSVLLEGQQDGRSMISFNETYTVLTLPNHNNGSQVDVSMKCSCKESALRAVRITVLTQADQPCNVTQAQSIIIGTDTSRVKYRRENSTIILQYDTAVYTLTQSSWGQVNCSNGSVKDCPMKGQSVVSLNGSKLIILPKQEAQCVPYFLYLDFIMAQSDEPQRRYWIFYMLSSESPFKSSPQPLMFNNSHLSTYYAHTHSLTTGSTSSAVTDHYSTTNGQIVTTERSSSLLTVVPVSPVTTDQTFQQDYKSTTPTFHLSPLTTSLTGQSDHPTSFSNGTSEKKKSASVDHIMVVVLVVLAVTLVSVVSIIFVFTWLHKRHKQLKPSSDDKKTKTFEIHGDACSTGPATPDMPGERHLLLYCNSSLQPLLVDWLRSHLQQVGTLRCYQIGDPTTATRLQSELRKFAAGAHVVLVLSSELRHILCFGSAAWQKCLLEDIGRLASMYATVSFDGQLSEKDVKYFRAVFSVENTYHLSGEQCQLGALLCDLTTGVDSFSQGNNSLNDLHSASGVPENHTAFSGTLVNEFDGHVVQHDGVYFYRFHDLNDHDSQCGTSDNSCLTIDGSVQV